MKYSPKPLDTSLVKLPEYLLELTEFLAENVHDIWACSRMEEGWTYGPQRDDMKQEHPSIVPYKDLSDSEKEYDRNTAIQTLKTIITLGYRIEKTRKLS